MSTDYRMHKSFIEFEQDEKIIDFFEHKLRELLNNSASEKMRVQYEKVLNDYIAGDIAVRFTRGQPQWLQIDK